MRLGVLTLIITTVVTMAGSVYAFDNQRKGFAFALGAGGGMYLERGDKNSDAALSIPVEIGWGVGERNTFCLDKHLLFAKCNDSSWCMEQSLGIRWQHFWLRQNRLFSMLSVTALDNEGTQYDITAGLGYEFERHVAASLSYIATRFSGGNLLDRDLVAVHLWYMWY
jgi:hypothetical protein